MNPRGLRQRIRHHDIDLMFLVFPFGEHRDLVEPDRATVGERTILSGSNQPVVPRPDAARTPSPTHIGHDGIGIVRHPRSEG